MPSQDEPKRPAPAGIQIDDEVDRTPSGIAIDDSPSAGIAIDEPLSSGIAIDDGRHKAHGDRPAGVLGDPMKLGFAEAKQIARHELDTARVLGLDAQLLREGKISTQAVTAQLSLFLERLKKMEEKDKALQRAASEEPDYGAWLTSIRRLRGETAADGLRKIVESEALNVALEKLRADARVHLSDGHLEWAEHQKMLWRATQLNLTAEHVEQVYREPEFGTFTRETEAEAVRKAPAGWKPYARLASKGEGAWTLGRLQDAMLERFDAAVEAANDDPERIASLAGYLNEKNDWAQDQALHARKAVLDEGCAKSVAAWYFLWATGRPALHVGKGSGPVTEWRRQVSTLADLHSLVGAELVLGDLGAALEDGRLEKWLQLTVKVIPGVVQQAEKLRAEAKRQTRQQLPSYLQQAAIKVLWSTGLSGLPVWDRAGRSVVLDDLPSLLARAEECWDALEWALDCGALAAWLDARNQLKGPARLSLNAYKKGGSASATLGLWRFVWAAGGRRLFLSATPGRLSPSEFDGQYDSIGALAATPITDDLLRATWMMMENDLLPDWVEVAQNDKKLALALGALKVQARTSLWPEPLAAYAALLTLGHRTLPLGPVSIENVKDIASLPPAEWATLGAAIASGNVTMWLAHAHRTLEPDRFRLLANKHGEPRAVQELLWLAGDPRLQLYPLHGALQAVANDRRIAINTPEELVIAYAGGANAEIAACLVDGRLMGWLRTSHPNHPSTAAADDLNNAAVLHAVLQCAGWRVLPIIGATKGPESIADLIDWIDEDKASPPQTGERRRALVRAHESGVLAQWLRLGLRDVPSETVELLAKISPSQPHAAELILIALGADRPKLKLDPPNFQIANLQEGDLSQQTLRVSAAGARGYLTIQAQSEDPRIELEQREGEHYKVESLSFQIAPGETREVPFCVLAPTGRHMRADELSIAIHVMTPKGRATAKVPVTVSTVFPWKVIRKHSIVGGVIGVAALLLLRAWLVPTFPVAGYWLPNGETALHQTSFWQMLLIGLVPFSYCVAAFFIFQEWKKKFGSKKQDQVRLIADAESLEGKVPAAMRYSSTCRRCRRKYPDGTLWCEDCKVAL